MEHIIIAMDGREVRQETTSQAEWFTIFYSHEPLNIQPTATSTTGLWTCWLLWAGFFFVRANNRLWTTPLGLSPALLLSRPWHNHAYIISLTFMYTCTYRRRCLHIAWAAMRRTHVARAMQWHNNILSSAPGPGAAGYEAEAKPHSWGAEWNIAYYIQ